MSDSWPVYKIIKDDTMDMDHDIVLDFGLAAKHSELEKHRASGLEIQYRMYRVGKIVGSVHWVSPWKLDTPSIAQKEIIVRAKAEAQRLAAIVNNRGYSKGYIFVKLKEEFGVLIAGYLYGKLNRPWLHECPKRKYDNEFASLTVDKCPDCGTERPKNK